MRKRIAFICLSLIAANVCAETAILNGVTVTFDLPKPAMGSARTAPFTISKGSNGGQQSVQIKFPGVVSAKYDLEITGNLTILAEPVPKGTATQDYFLHYFGDLTKRKGNVVSPDDDIIESGLPGKFDGLVKNDNGRVVMYDYVSAFVYHDVGFLVIFEITDDLYSFARPIAQAIIASIKLK